MLRVQPSADCHQKSELKCGEIFCQNFTDPTIYCSFCNMKLYALEDFLLHLQNEHLDRSSPEAEELAEEYIKIESMEDEDVDNWMENFPETEEDSQQEDDKSFSLQENTDEEEDYTDNLKTNSELISRENKEVYSYSSDEEEIKENENFEIIKTDIKISEDDDMHTETESNYEDDSDEFTLVVAKSSKINTSPKKSENKKKKTKKPCITFPCPECSEIFTLKKLMDQHVVDVHNGHKCSKCDARFRHRHHMHRHSLLHNPVKQYSCPVSDCSKEFANSEYLKRHLETHRTDRPFVCEYENCGKTFPTKLRLKIHRFGHPNKQNPTDHKPRNFVCDMCGNAYRSIVTLEVHQRSHTGEKPFVCEICKKSFASKSSLRIHMQTHSGRVFVCNICNAAFAKKQILNNHVFIHSTERHFKCGFCGKTYKQENVLRNHIAYVHKKSKPWPSSRKKNKEN